MKRLKPKLVLTSVLYLALLLFISLLMRRHMCYEPLMTSWSYKILFFIVFVGLLALFYEKTYLSFFMFAAYPGGYCLGILIRGFLSPDAAFYEKSILLPWISVILLLMFAAGHLDHPELKFLAKEEDKDDEI